MLYTFAPNWQYIFGVPGRVLHVVLLSRPSAVIVWSRTATPVARGCDADGREAVVGGHAVDRVRCGG